MNLSKSRQGTVNPAQASSGPWLNYLTFAIGTSLFLVPFLRYAFSGSDEGLLLCGAMRVAQGQVFARDFFEIGGPGTFYLLGAFFKLFGVTFLAARIYLLFSLLGTAIAVYFLSRRLCNQYKLLPCLILSGTYFGILGQGISCHIDGNFYALVAVICLTLWSDRHKSGLLPAAGVLSGITTCIFQPKGVLLFCACMVWLLLQDRRASVLIPRLCWMAGGYFAAIGAVLGYFWSQGALGSLIYADIIFPSHDYNAVNSVPYGFGILKGGFWTQWVSLAPGSKWSQGAAAVLITPHLFIAILPFALLLVGIRYRWKSATPAIQLLWLSGFAMWLSESHRRDVAHLVWGAPLLVILSVHLLGNWKSKFARAPVIVLYVSSALLAVCNLFAITAMAKPVTTRAGTITTNETELAAVVSFIDGHVPPGGDIFAYPYSPIYYFLTRTNNPTRYTILQYNYTTPEQFREVIEILDRRRVRFAIWDTNFLQGKERKAFPGASSVNPAALIVEPYLKSHYREVENFKGVRIMERLDGEDMVGKDSSAEKGP